MSDIPNIEQIVEQMRRRIAAIDDEKKRLVAELDRERDRLTLALDALLDTSGKVEVPTAPAPEPVSAPEPVVEAPEPEAVEATPGAVNEEWKRRGGIGQGRPGPSETDVRDFILAYKDDPFTRHDFVRYFGMKSTSTSSAIAHLQPFLARGIIEELPKDKWIKEDRPNAKPSATYRYVPPRETVAPTTERERDTIRRVPSAPVPGTGKPGRTATSAINKLITGAKPRPTVRHLPNGHKMLIGHGCAEVRISDSVNEAAIPAIRRDMEAAGYTFNGGS